MNAKKTKKSQIHENADVNITCDFGDSDISRCRSRLPASHIISSIIVRLRLPSDTNPHVLVAPKYTNYGSNRDMPHMFSGLHVT